jgi:signal transduction histidine kinase
LAPGRWLAAGVITDITEPKRLEEALQQSHALLAERADRLTDADRAKDEFLAMLAHELRNPLGAMSNAVQLFKQLGLPDPRMERAQEIIERQVEHQRRMLDDLLDVSRVARGKITLHPVALELARLVRDVAEDHRHNLEAGRLTLTLDLPDAPVWVSGDPTRLAQITGNLLQNAGKFTDPGGSITVALAVAGRTRV